MCMKMVQRPRHHAVFRSNVFNRPSIAGPASTYSPVTVREAATPEPGGCQPLYALHMHFLLCLAIYYCLKDIDA